MNTTFTLLKKNNAKPSLIKKMAKILGGIKKYGKDAPIPIAAILNFRGLEDAIWALRAVLPEHEAEAKVFARRFACRCVRETMLPDSRRVWDLLTNVSKMAVEMAEAYAEGKVSTDDRLEAACRAWAQAYKMDSHENRIAMNSAYAAAYTTSPEDDITCWMPGGDAIDESRRGSSIIKWGAWMASLESHRAANPRSAKADHFKFFRQLLLGQKG